MEALVDDSNTDLETNGFVLLDLNNLVNSFSHVEHRDVLSELLLVDLGQTKDVVDEELHKFGRGDQDMYALL